MGREEEIKVIAYDIWKTEGCHDGRDCDHWYRAELIWVANQKGAQNKLEASPDISRPQVEDVKASKAGIKPDKKILKQNKKTGKKS
jgi:hypothetical protein